MVIFSTHLYIPATAMKTAACLMGGVLLVCSPANSSEIFSDAAVGSGVAVQSSQDMRTLKTCLEADVQVRRLSRAIRACSKALKASAPNRAVRSNLLTQRANLQLSAGRFDKAARDFGRAARLNGENALASLGQGYAAIMQKDYKAAMAHFDNCSSDESTAPLALYGRAISRELSGDSKGAYQDYLMSAELRPDWAAPRVELRRFTVIQSSG